MSLHRVTSAMVGAVLACSATTQATETCWSPPQAAALKLRRLQVMMMVSALQCRMRGDTAMADAYNHFARTQGPALSQANTVLMRRYVADHGARAQRQLDSDVTQIANGYAAAPPSDTECADRAALARTAAETSDTQLATLAVQQFSGPDQLLPCVMTNRLAGLKLE